MEIKYEMEMKTRTNTRDSIEDDGKEGSKKEKGSKQTQMASHVYLVDFILVLGTMLLSTVPPNHLVSFSRWAR